MTDDELIKKVLENMEYYTISVLYDKDVLEFSDYRAHMILDPEEELFRHFQVKNVADLDEFVFEHNRIAKLNVVECERFMRAMRDNEIIGAYLKKVRSFSYHMCQYATPMESNTNFYKVNYDYFIIIDGMLIDSFEELNNKVIFHCSSGGTFTYNLIVDSKNRKWFSTNDTEISIFKKSTSLF